MVSSPGNDVRKEGILRAHDLFAMSAASNYDIEEPGERTRSTADLQRLFLQLVRVLEPSLFIEAGAMDAGISRRVRRILPEARIVAFEANPVNHAKYSSAVDFAGEGIEYVHHALSDSPGDLRFNLFADESGAPVADGNGSLLQHEEPPHGFVEVEVEAVRLDDFFASADAGPDAAPCALWIDVEGAGKQVLTGGRALLDQASVLMMELEDRAFWGQEWLRPQIYSYLYDRGLVPLARDFQARYLYNVVFVREALLDTDRLRWALALYLSSGARESRRRSSEDSERSNELRSGK